MSKLIRFAAIDPAIRNWGLVKFDYDPNLGSLDLIDMKLIETEKTKAKQVRANSDDLRRASEIYEASVAWMRDCTLFAAEIPSGSQSAVAAKLAGVCLGILVGLRQTWPLIEVQIAEAKKIVTGRKTASKDEMIQFAVDAYPNAAWLKRKLHGAYVPLADNEHLADAVAIGMAALKTHEFKAAVAMRSAMLMAV